MLLQVLSLTPEQINQLPPTERDTIMNLVRTPLFSLLSNRDVLTPIYKQRSQLGGLAGIQSV